MSATPARERLLKLPNAPLAEVVFEFRWALRGPADGPPWSRQDPGYPLLVPEFTAAARRRGYAFSRKLNTDANAIVAAHSVDFRFFKREDLPFPIWQIGPGIFACNESTNYSWNYFRKQCLAGVKTIYSCYPTAKNLNISPIHLEIRYIDFFNRDLLGHTNIVDFLNDNTNLAIDSTRLLNDRQLGPFSEGRLQLSQSIVGKDNTRFYIDVANARTGDEDAIALTSKVITSYSNFTLPAGGIARERSLSGWLDDAHGVTSSFFRNFISDALMAKFKAPRKAG